MLNPDHISKVFDMLLNGLTRDQIIKYVRSEKNKLQIVEDDIPALVAEAEARLKDFSQYEYQTELGRILKRFDDLYQRSYQINDFKACAQIEKMRAEVLSKNRSAEKQPNAQAGAPDPATITPHDRPGCDPRLFELAPLAHVSRELNVSLRTLHRWVKGTDPAYQPPMPHELRQRAIFVRPIVAYEHLAAHAARARGLRPPAGYIAPTEAAKAMITKATDEAAMAGIDSPRDFLLSFIRGTRKASPAEINALVNVVNSLTRAVEVEAKNARRYDIRDLLETAEDVRDAYIKGMDHFTVRTSLRLRNMVEEYFGVDLSAFANAQAIIQNALVDEFETLVVWFRDQIKEQLCTIEAKDSR